MASFFVGFHQRGENNISKKVYSHVPLTGLSSDNHELILENVSVYAGNADAVYAIVLNKKKRQNHWVLSLPYP